MYDAIGDAVEFLDADPLDIRWRRLPNASLVDVDLERRTLWLNDLYRSALSGSSRPDDTPLLKTLLLLLYSRFFEGSYLGDRVWRVGAGCISNIRAALVELLAPRGLREGRTRG